MFSQDYYINKTIIYVSELSKITVNFSLKFTSEARVERAVCVQLLVNKGHEHTPYVVLLTFIYVRDIACLRYTHTINIYGNYPLSKYQFR